MRAEDEPGYVTGCRASAGNGLVAHHVVVHYSCIALKPGEAAASDAWR